MKDSIDRQAAIDELRTCQTYLFDTHDKDLKISLEDAEYCIERLPPAQPEIIRCKDCKFAINADTDMMCGNPKSWVVATENDFGCILAERREQ